MKALTARAAAAAALCLATPLAAQPAAVPPPVEQHTADCRNPVYATDRLVCGDPRLRALDEELATALAGFTEPVSRWYEPQAEWFKRRSRCAFAEDHAVCSQMAYRERLDLLRAHQGEVRSMPARCDDPAVTSLATASGGTVLLDARGQVAGMAFEPRHGTWRAFLVQEEGPRLSFVTLRGERLGCRKGVRPAGAP